MGCAMLIWVIVAIMAIAKYTGGWEDSQNITTFVFLIAIVATVAAPFTGGGGGWSGGAEGFQDKR